MDSATLVSVQAATESRLRRVTRAIRPVLWTPSVGAMPKGEWDSVGSVGSGGRAQPCSSRERAPSPGGAGWFELSPRPELTALVRSTRELTGRNSGRERSSLPRLPETGGDGWSAGSLIPRGAGGRSGDVFQAGTRRVHVPEYACPRAWRRGGALLRTPLEGDAFSCAIPLTGMLGRSHLGLDERTREQKRRVALRAHDAAC
jgi:hypothetical protein